MRFHSLIHQDTPRSDPSGFTLSRIFQSGHAPFCLFSVSIVFLCPSGWALGNPCCERSNAHSLTAVSHYTNTQFMGCAGGAYFFSLISPNFSHSPSLLILFYWCLPNGSDRSLCFGLNWMTGSFRLCCMQTNIQIFVSFSQILFLPPLSLLHVCSRLHPLIQFPQGSHCHYLHFLECPNVQTWSSARPNPNTLVFPPIRIPSSRAITLHCRKLGYTVLIIERRTVERMLASDFVPHDIAFRLKQIW